MVLQMAQGFGISFGISAPRFRMGCVRDGPHVGSSWPNGGRGDGLKQVRTLKVSFSIFHRARPQAANSATALAETARFVTKLLRQVRFPLSLNISMENQLTAMASAVARNGTAESQR